MNRQVLLDKLSEFLMVEQCGLQLYQVVSERTTKPEMKQRYEEFGRETAMHREVLVNLIQQIGGDPNYVSPTARLVQWKNSQLLNSSVVVTGLSQEEIEANDLENVLLAETKDHADWSLLQQMAMQLSGSMDTSGGGDGLAEGAKKMVVKAVETVTGGHDSGGVEQTVAPAMLQQALQQAVDQVEAQEDEHLRWARETLAQMCMQMAMQGPAPAPERWQSVIIAPEPPIETIHPRPMDGSMALPPSQQPSWQDAEVARAMRMQPPMAHR